MRKIYEDTTKTQQLYSNGAEFATKNDINQLTTRIDNTIQSLTNLSDALSAYEQQMAESVNAEQLTVINALITSLSNTSAEIQSADIDNLTVSSLAELTNMVTQVAQITTSLTATNATITNLTSNSASIGVGEFETLKATSAEIDTWAIENLSVDNLGISNKITSYELDSEIVNAGQVNVEDDLSVSGDTSVTNLTASNISTDSISSDEASVENIHWKSYSTLSNPTAKVFLKVPIFENGTYFIKIVDPDKTVAVFELYNSIDNYFTRWSQYDYGIISNIYKKDNQLVIEMNNANEDTWDVYYASICSTPNLQGPATYSQNPFEDDYDIVYEVKYKDGNKFWKNVDLANQGGTIGVLRQLSSDDIESATNDVSYDTTDNTTIIVYKPDQSVNTDDDVAFHEVHTVFLNVRDFSTRNFISTELETLSTIDLTKFDDGSIVIVRLGSTAATNMPSKAYIKETIGGNPVLFDIVKARNMPLTSTSKPLVWDPTTESLIEADDLILTDLHLTGDLDVDGDVTILGTTSTKDANVDGDLSVTGTAVVHGDLFVDGVTHTTTEEQINTTSDTLVLRQNNNTTLGALYAGIIINKYNGVSDLALVTDSDGTLRVGTGSGTETVYSSIYWDDTTEKWYSDAALTTEVTPAGNLTSWASVETLGTVKHYIDAVFTQVNYSNLVPILGRDEESNMNDRGVLVWDSNDWVAKTTEAPTGNNQVLTNVQTPASSITVYSDETNFYNADTTPSSKPSGTAGDPAIVGSFLYYDNHFYTGSTGSWDKLNDFSDLTDVTSVSDPTLIGDLDTASAEPNNWISISSVTYTIAESSDYEWKVPAGSFVYQTMAAYLADASNVPNGSLVIILNENNYIIGENV